MTPTKKGETNGVPEAETSPPVKTGTGQNLSIPKWVNEEHFIDVIKDSVEGFKRILIFDAGLTGGKGENYASIMLRVKVKVELEDGSTKDLSYMIKTSPQNGETAMITAMMGMFPKETVMYGKCLPEFEQMYRDVGKQVTFCPKFYTLKENPGADYVLLEDLSPKGFKNVNRLEGLDKEHTESVLKLLAQLHAASAVRYETKGEYDKVIRESIFTETNRPMVEAMVGSLMGVFTECLTTYKISPECLEKVKTLENVITDSMMQLSSVDYSEFNVVNHGDLWANNIMFRYNDEGKREETIFIDFQVSRYGSPAMDLYYFLISSTNLDLKISHFDYFIKYYYDHLVDNLKLLGYPKKVPLLKQLRIQLLTQGFWAISTASGVMGAVLLDPNETANMENFLNDGEQGQHFKKQIYTNPRYVKHMEVVLPWIFTRGLLE